jgi:hypothetical protein
MMGIGQQAVTVVISTVIAFLLLLWWGRVYSARRIARWCEQEGYELVEWRGAKFFEGPSAWFRSDNEDAYYIEVRDRHGLTRAGYLVFGSFWWPFRRKVRVKWD